MAKFPKVRRGKLWPKTANTRNCAPAVPALMNPECHSRHPPTSWTYEVGIRLCANNDLFYAWVAWMPSSTVLRAILEAWSAYVVQATTPDDAWDTLDAYEHHARPT